MGQTREHVEVSLSMNDAPTPSVFEPPQEGLEKSIAQVWAEVFRQEQIGRNDNFFELGGNSLLGMDLTEILATRLGIQVSVVTLFQNPTIREMAAVISADHPS